jgi:hypothetical protein
MEEAVSYHISANGTCQLKPSNFAQFPKKWSCLWNGMTEHIYRFAQFQKKKFNIYIHLRGISLSIQRKCWNLCPSVIENFLTKKSIYNGYSIYRTSMWKEASRVSDMVIHR